MKLLVFLLLTAVFSINAQDRLKTAIDEKSGKPMLIGVADRSQFQDTSYSKWFNPEYANYRVKTKDMPGIAEKIKDFNITIVMGTWCSDSRREIPRFYKILDTLKYPESKVHLIMVDRKRKDLTGEVDSLKTEAVPTIIFYKNGKEEGRIIEAPKETLEKDIYNIVTGSTSGSKESEEENKEPEHESTGGPGSKSC